MKGIKYLSKSLVQNRSLILLVSALLVAVSAMTSVTFFVDRVDRALVLQGSSLMAADMVVENGTQLDESWTQSAIANNLEVSRQVSFPSVLFIADEPVLVQVKAVDRAYPLRGTLRVSDFSAGGQGIESNAVPSKGQVYLDSVLQKKLAQQDSINLGNLDLNIAGTIVEEPDRGGNLFQLAPRLLINIEDLPASGLLGPASRAKYRMLLAGELSALESFRAWAKIHLPSGAHIIDIQNARPELRTALERGQRFLSLASLCASLLAGIAILLGSRRYVNQAVDGVAVMRTLGMTSKQVMLHHLKEIGVVLVIGCTAGILFGYLGQWFLSSLIGDWFGSDLPDPGPRPLFTGLLYGAVLLLGFSLPVLWRIRRVSPLRVLRRELDPPDISSYLVWTVAIAAFLLLVFWQVQDSKLALAVVLALVSVMLIASGFGRLVLLLLRPFRKTHSALGMGLAALNRHASLTQWQLAGFSIGVTLLLILGMVRVDLIDTWSNSLSPTAPNHFLINIQSNEQQKLQQWFEDNNVANSGMYASSRGRLVAINDEAVVPESFPTSRGRRLAGREFSLGFSDQLQADNRIIKGEPEWPPVEPGFTVEEGLAKELSIQPGTTLTFDVAGQQVRATVTSLRSISWDSFNVNFFVQASETLKQGLPVAYLNSIYLDDNAADVMKMISNDYPAVSVLDLRPLLKQVRDIMDQGAYAVEAVFAFTLLAAMLVTVGAVQISREERSQEVALFRTFGATRKQILLGVLSEFGLLGMVIGVVSATLASVTGYLVATVIFNLSPVFNPMVWVAGVVLSLLVLLIVGFFSTRELMNKPPMMILNTER